MCNVKRKCDNCGKEYNADSRNLKRGWGLCCSKSCAASKREKSKPGYNPDRVSRNNIIREIRSVRSENCFGEKFRGYTSEGYRIFGNTAYDEFDDAVYNVDPYDDMHPFDIDK